MRRSLSRLLTLLALAMAVVLAGPVAAHADADDWMVERYDVSAEVQTDGTIDVSIDMLFDFADEEGHGPYLTLVDRQEIADDPDRYRVLEYTGFSASSSTGAPADVRTESEGSGLAVYVGDEDVEVTGQQQYTISYTVSGVPNPGAGADGADEVAWNVIGSGWEIPLRDVGVTVEGPEDPLGAECFTGSVGSTDACGTAEAGPPAEFTADEISPGGGMTVLVTYPAGMFADTVEPMYSDRVTPANFFGSGTPAPWVALGLGVVGIAVVALRARQRGRDRAYVGLTPGLTPTAGAEGHGEGYAERIPVAVQFTPPDGVTPGAAGTLLDEVAQPRDVSATIVDLAVRGYLRIEEIPEGETDDAGDAGSEENSEDPQWRLRRTSEPGEWPQLLAFERTLLEGLFSGNATVTEMSELGADFAQALTTAQSQLYERVVERGWFRTSPQAVRLRWVVAGIVAFVVGIPVTFVLGVFAGWGGVGVALMAIGVALMVCSAAAPARTAEGTAVLAQVRGFQKYLETAEVDQMRQEEREGIFSAYLPYAVALGVAQRWTTIFSEAAARGEVQMQPHWYQGSTAGVWNAAVFTSLTSFTTTAATSVTSVASGSAGGAGFSGGVGGGVGGGGGGGW
ncbi:DUF2207 domain-containing protein [Ruania suaedae]|uniref:DUF2207 domain-containing protein n=1 Tax=Ruania suaedae TaxID=2897774 RepID=UPI001E2EFBC6|nr:DUF2207 domain-containing protein [Ruania suaedae]UFU04007.1 DUF2207 domain-containing protein [Ruania suaedae]